jgi:hypothetical protein
MNRSGSGGQILQMYSQGLRPPMVLSLRAQLLAAIKSARCVCRWGALFRAADEATRPGAVLLWGV